MMADDIRINTGNDPFYQYRNIMGVPSRKIIICGIAFVFLILTLVVIAFAIMSNQCCTTKIEKLERYAAFPNSLNSSLDPCNNFYDFTCNSWSQNNFIPPDEPRVTTFSILQDAIDKRKKEIFENTQVDQDLPVVVNNAIRFYDLCINENRNSIAEYKVLEDMLNEFGGWPVLNKTSWNADMFDWIHASAFISRNFGVHTVIKAHLVDEDRSDVKNTFYIKNPSLYTEFNSGILQNNILINVILLELNISYTYSDISDLEEIETKWIKLFYDDARNKSERDIISLGELIEIIPEINWLDYLLLLLNDFLQAKNKTISLNDMVYVEDVNYLKTVAKVLSSDTFSKLDLANLFGWFAVKNIWEIIPGVLKRYGVVNHFDLADIKDVSKNKCYDLILNLFQCSLDYLYIKNSSISGLQDSKVLTTYIKSAFNDILQDSVWLDKVSKDAMLQKLHSVKDIIGFQAYQNNKTEIDKMYKDFPSLSDNLLQYYFQLLQYYSKFGSWTLPRSITHVSSYYMVNKNIFVFPISLHNPPFYYLNGPSYLNFGAIGSVIAHEIMHGFGSFDDDDKYQISNLFSNVSSIRFKKRADCFKNQYDWYDGTLKNNGTLTLRENIADSEGLRIAFEAYKKYEKDLGHKNQYLPFGNYSSDQMLFISYGTYLCSKSSPETSFGNMHSISELRVNGAVSNSEVFALAFKCPKGSPMNPVKKCLIW